MKSHSLTFRRFVRIAIELRITYWRETFRTAPVSSAFRTLIFALVVLQALATILGIATVRLPENIVRELRNSLDDIRIALLLLLPIAYLFQQIFSAPFFIRQSSSQFFCPYPIHRFHLALLRWIEGGLTIPQITGASVLLIVIVFTTQTFEAALWQWLVWCAILRTFVMLCHEIYCLIADRPVLLYLLYLGITGYMMWSFINLMDGTTSFSLSLLIAWFDAGFIRQFGVVPMIANGTIIGVLFLSAAWLYGFRMKNIAKYQ
jgi:hypothetical protein